MNKRNLLCHFLVFSALAVVASLLYPVSDHSQTAGDACTAGQLSGPDALGRNLICSGGVFVAATGYGIGSQWTTNGTDIYYNGGDVGIGTTTPASIFYVSKADTTNLWSTANSGSNAFWPFPQEVVIENLGLNTDQSYAGIFFRAGQQTSGLYINSARIGAIRDGNYKANLVFGTRNAAGTFGERMRIDGNGNVGIGTAAPNATLNVSGSLVVSTSAQAASNPSLYVGTNGNVGVGMSAPSTMLMASGTIATADATQNIVAGYSGNTAIELSTMLAAGGNPATNGDRIRLGWQRPSTIPSGIMAAQVMVDDNGLLSIASRGNLNAAIRFMTSGTTAFAERMRITGDGNVGIGTTNPNDSKVEVKGGTVCVDTNSDDTAASCIANESDARLKANVKPLAGALDKVMRLRGVSFDWKVSDTEVLKHYPLISRFAAKPHSIGLIAQEVRQVVPEAIEAETVGDGEVQYLQLDYAKLMPVALEAIKELKVANDNQAAQLRDLRAEFEAYTRTHP